MSKFTFGSFCVLRVILGFVTALTAFGNPVVLSLLPSTRGPQPVGSVITWTAAAIDSAPGTLGYRFRVGPHGGTLTTVKDYGPYNSFTWAPSDHEGEFDIEVSVE